MHRRDLLGALVESGLALTAGCLHDGLDGAIRPDGDLETVPEPLHCPEDGVERLAAKYAPAEVHWGDAERLALRVGATDYGCGDVIELTLTNIGDETEELTDYRSFNLEIDTADGWQDVRVDTEPDVPQAFPDDGTGLDSGETWHWEIELSESGVEEASFLAESTRVCPELQSGRYRFVFATQFGAEEAVAVAFDVSI